VRAALLLISVLGACGGARSRTPEPPPPPDGVTGFWELADGSHIVMQVAIISGVPQIDAWSMSSTGAGDTHFVISDASWDGKRLAATFTYPPSKTTTRSELVLVNIDRLEGKVTGAYSGPETWVRTTPNLISPNRPDAGA
jgi:hypothetical protein